MDSNTLSYLQELMRLATHGGTSRNILEKFMVTLRKELVFDNVVVYIQDESTQMLEIAYARAVGRSKDAEADAAWGDEFAGQVIKKSKLLMQDPKPEVSPNDRLHQAYLLGLPIRVGGVSKGAVIFVRFGGPVYADEHIAIASLAAELLSVLFERVT